MKKYDLYCRYLRNWHGTDPSDESPEVFRRFLYDSPVRSIELQYRDPSGRLLAVGICDLCELSLSSVYHYFDPAHAPRGLGTFGALCEIDEARAEGIPYYYLGYLVAGCTSMEYKSSFRPNEVLCTDGVWRESAAASGSVLCDAWGR